MRKILIDTMAPILFIMAITDFVMIIMMFAAYRNNRKNLIPLLCGILCIGLFYDSLILALGSLLDYGPLFQGASQLRYILHCVLIPLLFPICAYSFGANKKIIKAVWAVSIVIMAIGLAAGIMTVTEPTTVGAIKRYSQSELTPGFAKGMTSYLDVFPVFVMIGVGAVLAIKKKNPDLMLAGAFMLLFTLLGIFLGKDPSGDRSKSLMFYISMYGESLMVFFLYRFVKRAEKGK